MMEAKAELADRTQAVRSLASPGGAPAGRYPRLQHNAAAIGSLIKCIRERLIRRHSCALLLCRLVGTQVRKLKRQTIRAVPPSNRTPPQLTPLPRASARYLPH